MIGAAYTYTREAHIWEKNNKWTDPVFGSGAVFLTRFGLRRFVPQALEADQ
jgi:hypothetical protein